MAMRGDSTQLGCCTTCLVQLDATALGSIPDSCQMCQECLRVLRTAEEFRTKVQQAEQRLMMMQLVDMESFELVSCRLCLRQYPKAVKSLTCRIGETPQLKEWLEWSCMQQLSQHWFQHAICRFCYGKLRDCFEWHLAAEESAEYLRNRTISYWTTWQETHPTLSTTNADAIEADLSLTTAPPLNEDTKPYFQEQYVQQPWTQTPHISEKDEMNHGNYQESEYTTSVNSFDGTLLNLDDPYVVQGGDFQCPMCGASFTNSILYENHTCQRCDPNDFDKEGGGLAGAAAWDDNVPGNEKKVCNLCKKRFNKTILLEAHVLQVHQGKHKPFLCKFCSHAYLTHSHLKRHLKTAHKVECLGSNSS